MTVDDAVVRDLVPQVLSVLVRRGTDFATAEDAIQEALVRALRTWPGEAPDDPRAWLVTVAWRVVVDRARSEAARRKREERVQAMPAPEDVPDADDTLHLYFLCAHPELSPSSAVALTLRAIGGLTTRQIAEAYVVPEATMAQRISRAKGTVARAGVGATGDPATVMRVLYLVFNEGHGGDVDLAAEAIRLTRQLADQLDDPEVEGLLALMLLHHSRRASRRSVGGQLVPLDEQDRSAWDRSLAGEGIERLHRALARGRLGEFQTQAAIAALHADALRFEETDWSQIVEWYDELLRFADTPVVRLNRAVAVGQARGAAAGFEALDAVAADTPRRDAAVAHLHELAGALAAAADARVEAARRAPTVAERNHHLRRAADLNARLTVAGSADAPSSRSSTSTVRERRG